jgi:NADH:ubiquinone oxidoreductase subunit H
VAFYTLIERKIIRINQLRVGPNKIIILGILQPVFDGFKLFLKEINNLKKSPFLFYLRPIINFFISIIFWSFLFLLSINFINILFLFILGVTVYRFVLAG